MVESEDNDDSDIPWQVMPNTKRRLSESPKIHLNKRQNTNKTAATYNLQNSANIATTSKNATNNISLTNNVNMFSSLSDDDTEDDDHEGDNAKNDNKETSEESNCKPPQIIIPNIADVAAMVKTFASVIPSTNFNYKAMNDGQMRIFTKTIDSYRALVKYLNEKNVQFHTYQIRLERAYRVVIKNLHHSTPLSYIKECIESSGHKVRSIANVRRRITKEPLPMFFVDIEPDKNNKDIYNIKHIYNAIIKVEPPRTTDDIVQCHRCQEFGHTKAYCKKLVNCVKCGLGHLTKDCKKSKDIPARCVNCLQSHPASYKGCSVYQRILNKKIHEGKIQNQNQHKNISFTINKNDYPPITNELNSSYKRHDQEFSYSDVTRSQPTASFDRIEQLLQKQIELTNTLLNMMSLLMSKLCN